MKHLACLLAFLGSAVVLVSAEGCSSSSGTGGTGSASAAVCGEPSLCAPDPYAGNAKCEAQASDATCGDKFAEVVRCAKKAPCKGGQFDILGIAKGCTKEAQAYDACQKGTTPGADAGVGDAAAGDAADASRPKDDAGTAGTSAVGHLCNGTVMCPVGYDCVSINRNAGEDGFCTKTCTSDPDCAAGYLGVGVPRCASTTGGQQCFISCAAGSLSCPANLVCIDTNTDAKPDTCAEK